MTRNQSVKKWKISTGSDLVRLFIYLKAEPICAIYKSYWDTVAAKQQKYIRMLVQKAYNKLRVHLMIYNNINDILKFTINETKFRHCHYNWVYMRRFVSGIREL